MNKEQNVTFINKFANYIGLLIISNIQPVFKTKKKNYHPEE